MGTERVRLIQREPQGDTQPRGRHFEYPTIAKVRVTFRNFDLQSHNISRALSLYYLGEMAGFPENEFRVCQISLNSVLRCGGGITRGVIAPSLKPRMTLYLVGAALRLIATFRLGMPKSLLSTEPSADDWIDNHVLADSPTNRTGRISQLDASGWPAPPVPTKFNRKQCRPPRP